MGGGGNADNVMREDDIIDADSPFINQMQCNKMIVRGCPSVEELVS
jgi:hypothetical protein